MSVTTTLAAISTALNSIVFPATTGFTAWGLNLPQPPDPNMQVWAIPAAFVYKKDPGQDDWLKSAQTDWAQHNYEVEIVYLTGKYDEAPSILAARTQDLPDAIFDCLYKDVTLGGKINSLGYFNSDKLASGGSNYLKIGGATFYGGHVVVMVQEEKEGVPN